MKIKKLVIKNFRSIKDMTIYPSNLNALIGPNSVGKTNILKALDLVLGEGWASKAKVARELFYDPNEKLEIELEFESPLTIPNKFGGNTLISQIKMTMSLIPELDATTTINGNQSFYGQDFFKKKYHFVYIPSQRDLSTELRVSQWTMLGKMMRLIYENYLDNYSSNEEQLKEDFKQKMEPAKNFLEADFSDKITFKKFSDKFKEKCTKNSAGLANQFSPELNIYNLNWFYKTLQINIEESQTNKCFDCEEVGAGMQNLLMISIFQTYAELMGGNVIFGIEEPEIYLYPQAQRSLYHNLISLSENSQIFYTTHNPNFVNAARPNDITLLRKNNDLGTYKLEKNSYFSTENTQNDAMYAKIYTHFTPERNELFFAKKIVFVEGASDKILFTTLAEEKWQINLDDLGISIISCDGKAGVNYFIGVCRLAGIDDYFAVWDKDEDLSNPTYLDYALDNNKGLVVDPNLEDFLNIPCAEDKKVENAYKWAKDIRLEDIPDDFNIVKSFLTE